MKHRTKVVGFQNRSGEPKFNVSLPNDAPRFREPNILVMIFDQALSCVWVDAGRVRRSTDVRYLYGSKHGVPRRLVATFDSDPQLRSYVRWATLESLGEHKGKFEQGSA